MGRYKKYTDKQFLQAIMGGYPDPSGKTDDKGKPILVPGSGGIITTIATRIGCDWHTADEYCKNQPVLEAAIEDEKNRIIDGAESTLIRSIMGGNTEDAKWYLSKKAKDRGYGPEKETLEHVGEVVFHVVYDEDDNNSQDNPLPGKGKTASRKAKNH